MSNMIQVVPGFQYSVNIGYDLNREDKLKNFIPTQSSIQLLKEILQSTQPDSTDRARVLVGAYGKGKSHIVLTILSILMQRDRSLFVHLMPMIEEDAELKQLVDNYYANPSNKILPVIISGTSASLSQAFLLALQRALSENNLDIMPDTNYRAAVKTIEKWRDDYPEVYGSFKETISLPIDKFIEELENYNTEIYDEFERIYPSLTAGSVFNPFIGFDVADLYESVAKSLTKRGYLGLYVVYDEFSKYLESNITAATVSDTKMLQDFAEKCNRSGNAEMHLLLISHKEISNYIDKLPKQKVDGWRGVSDRFKHIHLNNNFSQTYEIISTVIVKDNAQWEAFCNKPEHKTKFDALMNRYSHHALFNDATEQELKTTVYGCYPLHPVSTFILPRLSEQVAQNERTLFTFLSADGPSTLSSFLKKNSNQDFRVITPDMIFDYFDPVFQKEPISGETHKTYVLAQTILEQIRDQELESKIVKTISLIYILGQFDKLKPIKEELIGIFSMEYTPEQINDAIEHLIKDEYVIYLRRSNDYLKLKQTSGIDIEQKISDTAASLDAHFSIKEALDAANIDNYIYPSRYNDEREMIRYFKVEFIEEKELTGDVDWNKKAEAIHADGVVYAIVLDSNDTIDSVKKNILTSSKAADRCIFIMPKRFTEIRSVLKEFNAVQNLRAAAKDDPILFDEYETVYEDLREVITAFISGYTHPEEYRSMYIYQGQERRILRKAALSELASEVSFKIFSETPVINNEAINKETITSVANTSRNKIIASLLRSTLEPNLGLTGSGQEVSIMRSTLLRKGVLIDDEDGTRIDLAPADKKMQHVLDTIVSFIMEAKKNGRISFAQLYDKLVSPAYHIGLRAGVIPIYIAAVFHEYHDDIVIENDAGQLPMNTDTIQAINSSPEEYWIEYLDWDPEKQNFVASLANLFSQYVIEAEQNLSAYEYAASAMKRWYLSLPKFAKDTKEIDGEKVNSRYRKMVKLLKQNLSGYELLFEKLPEAFGYNEFNEGLAENIAKGKEFYDKAVPKLKCLLIDKTKTTFAIGSNAEHLGRMSLSSVIKDWCETLDEHVFEQLFEDGTDKCLGLFREVTNDESTFISRLAKVATGLRVEDWDDNMVDHFVDRLEQYRKTAEAFHSDKAENDLPEASEYEIHFMSEDGGTEVKRFDRVESTKKGKLLYNSIRSEIESMGYSISEQEKRQILLEILKEMC
ncbi:MAG: restriction endonuclease subunit S [Eubacterium sp.]|nr:restriction endonuclease subunit S [Eubacterium sp.]